MSAYSDSNGVCWNVWAKFEGVGHAVFVLNLDRKMAYSLVSVSYSAGRFGIRQKLRMDTNTPFAYLVRGVEVEQVAGLSASRGDQFGSIHQKASNAAFCVYNPNSCLSFWEMYYQDSV